MLQVGCLENVECVWLHKHLKLSEGFLQSVPRYQSFSCALL